MRKFVFFLPAFLVIFGSHAQDASVAGNEQVKDIIENYKGRGTLADDTPLTPAQEAVKKFRVRDGFEIELMAAEPDVGQPLFMSWDSRGRLWVNQYLQYQFPAGLKIVEYDNHLRARFDKVPQPPPYGTKGADKITVFEDTDGDGYFDESKDVITGLNIATSVETGHGGIWVANPPYLLFYPDHDKDDIPDSEPEVRLSGFGIEDTHSVMNSLEWGPDGWLYGVDGSTTTGKVKCPATDQVYEWQGQMVWRYHPETRHFEIFAEGGGNTFSLEIDSKGNVFSGTNNGNTRGMYYPQGSYGKKGWGKHGPLTNPYAFGYFDHMEHEGDKNRFAQSFCIYDGGLYPPQFKGKIIAPNSLHNVVWVSELREDTSTFRTVDEENLAETDDRWFRPVFAGVGPDGCVYIADWSDTRLSHVRPVDDWHKESGRIYRIKPKGSSPVYEAGDLSSLDGAGLLSYLDHPNRFVRRRAVLEIGWRQEHSIEAALAENVRANLGQTSLESLWAFSLLNRLDDDYASEWIKHPDPNIRRWVIRLKGDKRKIGSDFAEALLRQSEVEKNIHVRSQMAASAKRISAQNGLPVLKNLISDSSILEDKHLPLMIWWGIEAHAESGREILKNYARSGAWEQPVFREQIAERLMRRYAMAGGNDNFQTCANLLETAPDQDAQKRLMTGLQLAFQGSSIPPLPDSLSRQMDKYSKEAGENDIVLGVLRKDAASIGKAKTILAKSTEDPVVKLEIAKAFGTIDDPSVVSVLLRVLSLDQNSALKRVALRSLANYTDLSIPKTILGRYGSTLPAEHNVRSTADRVLAGRLEWARLFLDKIDLAHIKARDISPDVVQILLQHKDPEINKKVSRHWPDLAVKTSAENLAEINRVKQILQTGTGDADAGKIHFQQRCAVCHKLFDEGGVIAPDLTGYERNNLDFWLPGIIDPNLEIREGFATYLVKTNDERVLMGMISAQDPQSVVLRDAANQSVTIPRSKITKLEATPGSLMPPGLLNGLTDEQLRDLFAYLQKP
ncbi:MAG: c-type cytochrome [Verrucomicrobiales bacterium]|nr:c-type cytochrome [Verrucomicrobiales bacterium]